MTGVFVKRQIQISNEKLSKSIPTYHFYKEIKSRKTLLKIMNACQKGMPTKPF